MARRPAALLTVFVLLGGACGSSVESGAPTGAGLEPASQVDETGRLPATSHPDATIDPTFLPRPGPEPEAPAGDVVASLTVEDVVFDLYDEGDGCLAVAISSHELRPMVDRGCFNEYTALRETTGCGWLTTTGDAPQQRCDVGLPIVLYGRITNPSIGFVCVGTIEDTDVDAGVTGARFIDPTAEGYMLEAAQPYESARATHLFGTAGNRYGDPPLDAPSGYIYEICEALSPWGEAGNEYVASLNVHLPEVLRRDEVTIWLDGGLGTTGFGGGAFDDVPGEFSMMVPASSSRLTVAIELEDGTVAMSSVYPWPEAVIDILASGVPCTHAIHIDLSIEENTLDGVASGLDLSYAGSECD